VFDVRFNFKQPRPVIASQRVDAKKKFRESKSRLRHSGAMPTGPRNARPDDRLRIDPGISRFRVWSCGPSRNDGVWVAALLHNESSYSAKAEYPVRRSFPVPSLAPRITGSPAGACHRAAIRPTRWRAMTAEGVAHSCSSNATSRPRGAMRPSRAFIFRPQIRAWGMPGARCTRGLVCNCSDRTHTSNNEYTGIARHSRTQWF
jgi:hypothetical protein